MLETATTLPTGKMPGYGFRTVAGQSRAQFHCQPSAPCCERHLAALRIRRSTSYKRLHDSYAEGPPTQSAKARHGAHKDEEHKARAGRGGGRHEGERGEEEEEEAKEAGRGDT